MGEVGGTGLLCCGVNALLLLALLELFFFWRACLLELGWWIGCATKARSMAVVASMTEGFGGAARIPVGGARLLLTLIRADPHG